MLAPVKRVHEYFSCAVELGKGPVDSAAILWKETKNLRVRLGVGKHQPEKIYSLRTKFGPLYFRDNFGDITNLVNLLYREVYRWRELPDDGVVLDVGANIGLAAVWFHHFNPGRPVYCFEPLATNVELIRRNCPSAIVRQVALGQAPGRVSLAVDRDDVIASKIECAWDTRAIEFPVLPLDDYVRSEGIDQVAVLKIDAEGMENEILDGGLETLRITRRVVMETHGESAHQRSIEVLRKSGLGIESNEFDGRTGMLFAVAG